MTSAPMSAEGGLLFEEREQAHERRDRVDVQFPHRAAPVNLHRLFGNPSVAAICLLIRPRTTSSHTSFSRWVSRDKRSAAFCCSAAHKPMPDVPRERPRDGVEQL